MTGQVHKGQKETEESYGRQHKEQWNLVTKEAGQIKIMDHGGRY